MAGRLRTQGRVLVLSGRDLGAEAAAESPSPDLDRGALAGHVRLRGEAPVQHPLLAPDPSMSEVELYKGHMERALADNPGKPRPIFATMRHTVVYERKEDWEVPVKAAMRQFGQFKNLGDVADGFPRTIDLSELENRGEYDPHMLHRNLMFGPPDVVIAKLRDYEELGVDHFTYYASLGLGMKEQKRSMELFVKEVMPAFA